MEYTSKQTPLWLEIKTDYIDENFDKVIDYLYKCSITSSKDSFYSLTIDLIQKRSFLLLDQIKATPLSSSEDYSVPDNSSFKFYVRLLALCLLVCPNLDDKTWKHIYVSMLSHLSSIVLNYSNGLTEIAIKVILGKISRKLPFGFHDLQNFQPNVLAYRIVNSSVINTEQLSPVTYEGKGKLEVRDGVMSVSLSDNSLSLVPSISIFDDQIIVKSDKNNKIKQSDSYNLVKLDEFTHDFIVEQRNFVTSKLLNYSEGDLFFVVITGFAQNSLLVSSIDNKYQKIKGYVDLSKSLFYYDSSFFLKYLYVGDVIKVELVDAVKNSFSIEKEFVNYLIDYVAQDDFGSIVQAFLLETKKDKKGKIKQSWITEHGNTAYTFFNEDTQPGDYANIRIISHGTDNYYGYITAEFESKIDEEFNLEEVRKNCIQGFCYNISIDKSDTITPGTIKELVKMLIAYQHSLSKPSERYKILCSARILAELIEEHSDSDYIRFISDYLENLVFFTKGNIDKIESLVPNLELSQVKSVQKKIEIVDILKSYGNIERNSHLTTIIQDYPDKFVQNLAILVQSCNRIGGIISESMRNVIKREITKCLSIEMDGDTDLEEENGIYLGIENNRQEFKTSFFHAPVNAKEKNQKITVFRCVCAFLNSQAGGTLFIGVDDSGYVKGIADDISFMEKNVYGNYYGIDGYVRCITDEAKKHFDIGVLTYVSIEPMYDESVVAISVKPYEYNVVTMDKIAYVRLNNESVVMTEPAKRQLLDKRIFSKKEKAANVSSIMEAIRDRRKVIFHNYQSSYSGQISNRKIEPFAFATGHSHIWCYDLDKEKNTVFVVDRIGNVEILDEHWSSESLHKQGKMDAFHMTGETPIHVILKINLMAKNLLCEEYPDAKSSIFPCGDNTWNLDIDVYNIKGIGRFYMGLANCIEIIDAPELEDYVKTFVKENLV